MNHFCKRLFDGVEGEECDQFMLKNEQSFIFVYVDDLRYMLDADPLSEVVSERLIKISKQGVLFDNAHAPKSVCTPSRVSLMTGRRVQQHGLKSYTANFKSDLKTFPGVLKQAGYQTFAFGKVFDAESFDYLNPGSVRNYNNIDVCETSTRGNNECSFDASYGYDRIKCLVAQNLNTCLNESDLSFFAPTDETEQICPHFTNYERSETCTYTDLNNDEQEVETSLPYQTSRNMPNQRQLEQVEKFLIYEGGEPHDHTDYGICTAGLQKLQTINSENTGPSFLSIGLTRPHLPFSAPQRSFDKFSGQNTNKLDTEDVAAYYNVEDSDDFIQNSKLPKQMRPGSKEENSYTLRKAWSNPESDNGVSSASLDTGNEEYLNEVRKGYYASVNFVDDQISRIYSMWNDNPEISNKTNLIITSDHGFHLGEFGRVGKWTTLEAATRVPLLFIPSTSLRDYFQIEPKIVKDPIDQVDLFPTFLDLTSETVFNQYYDSVDIKDIPGDSLMQYIVKARSQPLRSLAYSEYDNFDGNGIQVGLRSKYFRYIYFDKEEGEYLFDYREECEGCNWHRMIERENLVGDVNYEEILEYFRNASSFAKSSSDEKVYQFVVGEKLFDESFSSRRGENFVVETHSPTTLPTMSPSSFAPTSTPIEESTLQPSFSENTSAQTVEGDKVTIETLETVVYSLVFLLAAALLSLLIAYHLKNKKSI